MARKIRKMSTHPFLLMDYFQRHSAARANFGQLKYHFGHSANSEIADRTFIGRLEHAKNHPNDTQYKALLAKLTPQFLLIHIL